MFPAGNTTRRGCRKIKNFSGMLFLVYFCMIAQKQRTRTANPGAQPETLQKLESHAQHKNPRHIRDAKPSGLLDRVPQPPAVSEGNRTKPTQHRHRPAPDPKAKKPEGQKAGRRHARPAAVPVCNLTDRRAFLYYCFYIILCNQLTAFHVIYIFY